VLENLDKTVLEHILCIFSAIGVANGGSKKLPTEARIKLALGRGLLPFAPFNQFYEFL
jgi:hypothetical protein